MVRPFTPRKTGDAKTDAALLEVGRVLGDVNKRELLQYNIIEDIAINGSTDISVKHGLGRRLKGWIVIRSNIAGGIRESATQGDLNTELRIAPDFSGTVSLLVF